MQQQFTNNWFDGAKSVWAPLLRQHKPQRILEIGSYEGASICFCIQTLCPLVPDIEVHCVDTWEGGEEHQPGAANAANMSEVHARFNHNLQIEIDRASCDVRVVTHRELSALALARLVAEGKSGYFDLIYIDGSHQAPDVLVDAVLAFQLARVGGMIIFDDYLWSEPGVNDVIRCPKLAIDAFTNIYAKKIRLYTAPLYQIYAKKIAA